MSLYKTNVSLIVSSACFTAIFLGKVFALGGLICLKIIFVMCLHRLWLDSEGWVDRKIGRRRSGRAGFGGFSERRRTLFDTVWARRVSRIGDRYRFALVFA